MVVTLKINGSAQEVDVEGATLLLCTQIKNPDLNGGRSPEDLIDHNGRDHLVNWAWNPGEGRTPAPGDRATLGALTKAWVEAGAHCPPE